MTDQELQQLVEKVSLEHFGKPFQHQATFNNRLSRTGGRYFLESHNLDFSTKQYEAFGKDALIDIIKHELCHYHLHLAGKGYKHRDQDFKRLSKAVGAPRHCAELPEVTRRKHLYTCTSCGQQYARVRRIDTTKYRCGKCHGMLQPTRKT